MSFHMLSSEVIKSGRATDAYFDRTVETLRYADRNPVVSAEVTLNQFETGRYRVFAGLHDAARLLEDVPVDVEAIPEGRLFDAGPVMRITGNYLDFARYETAILGFLSHATGIATNALTARVAAPDAVMSSFGTRHVHPVIAPMVERSALIAGFDGFSHVAAGEILGREAGGTMPHSLVMCFGEGNQEAAWVAFDEAVGPEVPRVALCDTFTDERDESLRAARALGEALDSVRLDTTGSRRGDFRHIIREVRWELDGHGFEDVGIFISGGLTPDLIYRVRDVVDGFGVGGYVSNADPVDFALDIVEIEGSSVAKRGKLAGTKEVYRTAAGGHVVVREGEPGPADGERLLEPVVEAGNVVMDDDLDVVIDRCREDADRVGFSDRVRASLES